MAKYRDVQLQQRTLAKLMLLEYFRPEYFRRLAELQSEQEGKPKQLSLLEQETLGVKDRQAAEKAEKLSGGTLKTEPEKSGTKSKQSKDADQEAIQQAKEETQKLDGEFKSWLTQNWIHEWLKLEPALADTDLRP